jgi:hypothetical protein
MHSERFRVKLDLSRERRMIGMEVVSTLNQINQKLFMYIMIKYDICLFEPFAQKYCIQDARMDVKVGT